MEHSFGLKTSHLQHSLAFASLQRQERYSKLTSLSPHQLLYIVHSQIPITFMFVEHLNNGFLVLTGVCSGFGAGKEHWNVTALTRTLLQPQIHWWLFPYCAPCWCWWASPGDSSLNELWSKLCISLLPAEQSTRFLWQPAVPRSSTN